MTDKKISELTSITGGNVSDANDVLVIVDTDANTTKKITREELFKGVSGNVGFGTSSPASKVHGYGDINGSISIEAQNINAGTSAQARFKATSDGGNVSFAATSSGYTDITSAADAALINTGSLSGGLVIAHDGVGKVWFAQSGNVGFGTASPFANVHIQDAAPELRMYSNNTTGGLINFIDQGWQSQIQGSGGHLMFMAGGATEGMRLTSGRDLGLGTPSPSSGAGAARVLEIEDTTAALRLSGTTGAVGLEMYTGASLGYVGTTSNHGLALYTNNSEAMRLDSSGSIGHGTSAPDTFFHSQAGDASISPRGGAATKWYLENNAAAYLEIGTPSTALGGLLFSDGSTGNYGLIEYTHASDAMLFFTAGSERTRLNSSGDQIWGATSEGTNGSVTINNAGYVHAKRSEILAYFDRTSTDGSLVEFRQDGTAEGSISVSGTTVSYNGAHLSRWSRLPGSDPKHIKDRQEILRGSVLTNLDEMILWRGVEFEVPVLLAPAVEAKDEVWGTETKTVAYLGPKADGEKETITFEGVEYQGTVYTEDNEQLNKMEVSSVKGDKNVSGVFQDWDDDDDEHLNDFYCAMTGDFVIRIAKGCTVQRGDLLMSAGDGTACPQEGELADVVRSCTVAKVTSTTVSHTYADGSYLLPCVLMAC